MRGGPVGPVGGLASWPVGETEAQKTNLRGPWTPPPGSGQAPLRSPRQALPCLPLLAALFPGAASPTT